MDLSVRDCTDFIEHFALAGRKYYKEGGGICLASMLWSIWLARNDFVFNKSRISGRNLELIIKYRAFTWAQVSNLIAPGMENIWNLDPRACINLHGRQELKLLMSHWFSLYPLLGFIDGSYIKNQMIIPI